MTRIAPPSRLVFLGTPEMAVPPLRALVAAGFDVALVVTRVDKRRGRGSQLMPSPVKAAAIELGLPVSHSVDDALAADADLGVVVAFGQLIKPHVLAELAMVNLHFSLLPRWRGAAPVERALLAGDTETGVTIHETVKELDAGPIAAQRPFLLTPDDDAGTVFARSVELADELLAEVLPEPAFRPQTGEPTYAAKIEPVDRELDLTDPVDSFNRIRALSPHIGARGELRGRGVTIWRARLEDGELVPLEVQPEGGKRMAYDAFIRGIR